ncbi:MAG: EAL domain-containing protein [Verrucomicrobia bacterium]|nr:EAL domain-containing protein [Verrucomicrobiota bacterium]
MKALIVVDAPEASSILTQLLKKRGYDVTACTTAAEAKELFSQTTFPLVLLDLDSRATDGFSLCRWIRSRPAGDQPLIMAGTASGQAPYLRMILEAGADDYILKPYEEELVDIRLIIASRLLKNREIYRSLQADLLREQEHLDYLAAHDPLTRLLNGAAFMELLQNAVRAAYQGAPGALLYIDLDSFKLISDSLGHSVGDTVLAQVANLLRLCLRYQDVPARLESDEFVALLEQIRLSEARMIAERIRSKLEQLRFSNAGTEFAVASTIGLATIDGTVPAETVMARADAACYAAKARGKNRVATYDRNDEIMAKFSDHAPRAAEIREAIRSDSFVILFQPIVDVQTALPVAYEALIRLPKNGKLLSPSVFVPAAEHYNLMPEIDRQVITKALKQLVNNNKLRLAINLSGQSFGDSSLSDFVQSSFRTAGVEPARVTFEITETAVISNLVAASKMMRRLRERGFRFALDDFGAGFSSFAYLKNLAADYLKIDGNFVRDAETGRSDWIFVEIINEVAHRLKMKSVAEFVEQEATLAKLRAMGVDFAQGYLFGAPVPPP